jgi:hypothetical protein
LNVPSCRTRFRSAKHQKKCPPDAGQLVNPTVDAYYCEASCSIARRIGSAKFGHASMSAMSRASICDRGGQPLPAEHCHIADKGQALLHNLLLHSPLQQFASSFNSRRLHYLKIIVRRRHRTTTPVTSPAGVVSFDGKLSLAARHFPL